MDDYKRLDIGTEPYTLDIFHFLGLHVDFSQRYLRNYSTFSSKDYSRTDISEEDKQILADYDNAIVYNDFVIDSIIKLYENKDAVIIFVPDHGERVFDHSKEWGRSLTWNKMIFVSNLIFLFGYGVLLFIELIIKLYGNRFRMVVPDLV